MRKLLVTAVMILGLGGLSAMAQTNTDDFDTEAVVKHIAPLQWTFTWDDYLYADPSAATTLDKDYPENRTFITSYADNSKTYLYFKEQVVFPMSGNYFTVNLEGLDLPDGKYEITIPEGYVTLVPGGGLPWEDNVTQYADIVIGEEITVEHEVRFSEIEGNFFDVSWTYVTLLTEAKTTGASLTNLDDGQEYEMPFLFDDLYSKANLRIVGNSLRVNLTNNHPDLPDGNYQLFIPAGYVYFNGTKETNQDVTYDFRYEAPFDEGEVEFNGPFEDGTVTIQWVDAEEIYFNEDYTGDPFSGTKWIFLYDSSDALFNIPFENVDIEGNMMTVSLNGLGIKSGKCRLDIPQWSLYIVKENRTGLNNVDGIFDFMYVNPDQEEIPEPEDYELYPGQAVWSVTSGETVYYGTLVEVTWPGTTIARANEDATVGIHTPQTGYLKLSYPGQVRISDDGTKLILDFGSFPDGTYRINVDEGFLFIEKDGTTYLNTSTWLENVTIDNRNQDGVESIGAENGRNVIYNLNGVRVDSENPAPGIYVVNGKKIKK